MGTKIKVSAAVLVTAASVYFVAQIPWAEPPQVESPRQAAVEQPSADVGPSGVATEDPAADLASGAVRRSPVEEAVRPKVEEGPPDSVPLVTGTKVLRVILEGVTEDEAGRARVTVTGVDKRRDDWPSHIRNTWPYNRLTSEGSTSRGLTSEFDLDPFFASVERATNWDVEVHELEVKVGHPLRLDKRTRVPLSHGVVLKSGQTIYEVRVRLVPGVPHVFWPELTLAVRDAQTLAHLKGVELRCVPNVMMGLGQVPGKGEIFTSFDAGLSSPIVLRGGREADGPEDVVVGVALRPAADEAPQLLELLQPLRKVVLVRINVHRGPGQRDHARP